MAHTGVLQGCELFLQIGWGGQWRPCLRLVCRPHALHPHASVHAVQRPVPYQGTPSSTRKYTTICLGVLGNRVARDPAADEKYNLVTTSVAPSTKTNVGVLYDVSCPPVAATPCQMGLLLQAHF